MGFMNLKRPTAAFRLALLSAFLALPVVAVPSCAALQPVIQQLPKVVALVQDAALILDSLESSTTVKMVTAAKPELATTVAQGFARARSALSLFLRATNGVEDLTQAQIVEAFSASGFAGAYTDLLALLGPLGVRRGGTEGSLSAPPGATLVVPDPLLLRL